MSDTESSVADSDTSSPDNKRYNYYGVFAGSALMGLFKERANAVDYIHEYERFESQGHRIVKTSDYFVGDVVTDFKLH